VSLPQQPPGAPARARKGAQAQRNAPTPQPAAPPDFARMSPEERLAYHRGRLNRMFGE
jgi:hypothetical protein